MRGVRRSNHWGESGKEKGDGFMFPKAHTFILLICALVSLSAQRAGNPHPEPTADCPLVGISGSPGKEGAERKYILAANISGADPKMEPKYKWCISAGKITKGEGTYEIEIDAADVKDEGITVTVIIGGFPWPCDNVAVYKVTLPKSPKSQAATPNNGMHPTADTQLVIYSQRLGAAGDAGRSASYSENHGL